MLQAVPSTGERVTADCSTSWLAAPLLIHSWLQFGLFLGERGELWERKACTLLGDSAPPGLGGGQGWFLLAGSFLVFSERSCWAPNPVVPLAQAGTSVFWGIPAGPQTSSRQLCTLCLPFRRRCSFRDKSYPLMALTLCSAVMGSLYYSYVWCGEELFHPCSDHSCGDGKSNMAALSCSSTRAFT